MNELFLIMVSCNAMFIQIHVAYCCILLGSTKKKYGRYCETYGFYRPLKSLEFNLEPCLTSVSRYRVLAFDHDLLSFSDLRFEQWPAVLITNPKDAQYLHPGVEPLGRIRRSTHIRLLFCVCVDC